MLDGGIFSSDVDGGTAIFPNDIFLNVDLAFTSDYLFDSGNLSSFLNSGVSYNTFIETGMLSKFYKITASNVQSSLNNISNEQLFQLLPSSDYGIYDIKENIIYSKNPSLEFKISGKLPNGKIVTATVRNLLGNMYNSQSTYYRYVTHKPIVNNIVPENLLYVYNLNSQESIDIKNYYFSLRTGVTGCEILGINCEIGYSGELTSTGNYINNIRTPIHRHIITGKKPIKYVTLFHGIPTQIVIGEYGNNNVILLSNDNDKIVSCSVAYDLSTSLDSISGYSRYSGYQYRGYTTKQFINGTNLSNYHNIDNPFLFEEYSGNTALFTHICSLSGRTADVSGYIERICNSGIASGVYLVGNGQNNTFLCYNNLGTGWLYTGNNYENNPVRPTSFYSGLGVNISISKPRTEYPFMTGKNIGGFVSNGWHGLLYEGGTGLTSGLGAGGQTHMGGVWESYPVACTLEGYNWYIAHHFESFAGDMLTFEFVTGGGEMSPHSPISRQIRPGAMGGTNYSNIPLGFVGYMLEPSSLQNRISYFDAWFNGRPFIECAYIGLNMPHCLVWGDPLLKWK